MKMRKVNINGINYLGTIVKNEDGTFTLNDAFELRSGIVSQDAFLNYLEAKNLDELEPLEFGGQGNNYTIFKITKDQKLDLQVCELSMKRAKSTAVKRLENRELRGLMGK